MSPSFLEMADDDILAFNPLVPATPAPVVEPEVEEPEPTKDEEVKQVATPALAADTDPAAADLDETPGAAEGVEDKGGKAVVVVEPVSGSKTQPDPNPKPDTEAPKVPDTGAVDYKAAYERLTAPFKANGRDISVNNVEDAIVLMQMGANYNKKMAALKPNLKLLKLLENNGLLSEDKLSYLIDLDKKSPEAISKLVKDSGLDPLDLDADKAGAYKPKSYAVDEREVELDAVLDELQDSPTYSRTLDIVSNKWDGASKQIVANSPQLLKVINGHLENGIYDLISAEVERERVFGRMNGLSDIEAYRQVGDAIQARGGFDHLGKGRTPQGQQALPAPIVVPPKPKQADDDKLREKRRAASATKPAAPSTTPPGFNPLALSDEEFAKVGINKFL